MTNTPLQNQLGLGLAVKQTNAMNGNPPPTSGGYTSSNPPPKSQTFEGDQMGATGYFFDEKDGTYRYQQVDSSGNIGIGANQQEASNVLSSGGGTNPIRSARNSSTILSAPPSVSGSVAPPTPTYGSGGLNTGSLVNMSGTKTEKVKRFSPRYDDVFKKQQEILTADPTKDRTTAMREARSFLIAQNKPATPVSDPYGLNRPEAQTGIEPLDLELQKLRQDKADAIKDTFKSYSLAQADYNKNKGYFTNFDATNNTFNSVLSDIQSTLSQTGAPQLSDMESQAIAQKYGINPEDVKNPLNIYKKLEMTDEGKQVLGVTDRENELADKQIANDRIKQDAQIALERNTAILNQNIADAERELKKNVDWATASGAWSGANRSSGYEQGIYNMKEDTSRIIGRINQQLQNLNADNVKDLSRLQEDFTTGMTRAKASLDTDIKNLKFNTGIALNGLEEKYGSGSKDLLKALDKISEEFGTKSLDTFNKYITSIKGIQGVTLENLNLIDKMNTVNDAMKNKRYNELLANNGALLGGISLTDIANEVKAGKMDMSRYADLKNLMTTSIVNTLSKTKTLSTADVNTIGYLLDNGSTPTQIIAQLGGGSRSYSGGGNGVVGSTIVNINNSALAGIDFRTPENIGKYKNEASVKYNNPAGLTWGISEELKGMLNSAGVQYGEGGKRPPGEGGNYITFPTVADGVKAYTISLTQRGDDIYSRLYSWSAGGDKNTPEDVKIANKKEYANGIMRQAGIPEGGKFSELSQDQLAKLMYFQMGKESPGFQKELDKIGFFQSLNTPTANASKTYTQDQKNLMDTISGDLTEAKIGTLKAGGLTVQDLANYRAGIKPVTNTLDYDSYESRIMSYLPNSEKGSEAQMKKLASKVQIYMDAGYTPEQAALAYRGFKIDDPAKADEALKYTNILENLKTQPNGYIGKISDFINNGDTQGLNNFIDTAVDREVDSIYGEKTMSRGAMMTSNENIDKVVGLIDRNLDKIGAFDGRISSLLKKVKDDPEYQELQTLLTMTQADIRKYFAGSAVTETEMSALVDFIGGKTTMTPGNLKTQLSTIRDANIRTFNNQRSAYGVDPFGGSTVTQTATNSNPVEQSMIDYLNNLSD